MSKTCMKVTQRKTQKQPTEYCGKSCDEYERLCPQCTEDAKEKAQTFFDNNHASSVDVLNSRMQDENSRISKYITKNQGFDTTKLTKFIEQKGCWVWTGSTNNQKPDGYSQMPTYDLHEFIKGAHQVSLYLHGKTKYGLTGIVAAHHLCDNRTCVNPEHLEEVEFGLHETIHNLQNPRLLQELRVRLILAYPENEQDIEKLFSKF